MMPCQTFRGGVICYQLGYWIRDKRGKIWHFEWHNYLGPTALSINSEEPLKRIPGEKSPFWEAVTHWHSQGKRTVEDLESGKSWAVWDDEPLKTELSSK